MAEYKLLITTSGIGSRLSGLTDFSNKSLVRVGGIAAISRIIDLYEADVEIVVTLGHFGDLVKQYLELVHPERKIQYAWVENFDGPGSSQALSILAAKSFIDKPFIYHTCDTLLEEKINFEDGNWIGVYKDADDYNMYTTVSTTDSQRFLKFNPKGTYGFQYAYIGVCAIKNFELYFEIVEDLISDENNKAHSDCDVINLIKENFKIKVFKEWYDIGNIKSLMKAREKYEDKFEVLDKPKENIYFYKNNVIKFFYDSELNKKRIDRFDILSPLVPKLIKGKENYFKYEFAKGEVLSETVNPTIMRKFLKWCKSELWKNEKVVDNAAFKNMCFSFYKDKTHKRIQMYKDLNDYRTEHFNINGMSIESINNLLNKVDFEWLSSGIQSRIHGDLILDNVLYDEGEFCLIDWRQDFAGNTAVGDLYYDLAKLNHNLVFNHKLVNEKKYFLHYDDKIKSVKCDILCSKNLIDCRNELKKFIINNNFDLYKVELLTAIIWINMSPLHDYPLNEFLFNFGKYNLASLLNGEE